MSGHSFELVAAQIARQLGPQPRVAIIGSASFWGDDSDEICAAVGTHLAACDGLALLTGGVPGVGEEVGRSFYRGRQHANQPPGVYHILPLESQAWDYGTTLFAGSSMFERREILGRLAPVYISIEGGPGTAHEAEVARRHGGVIVPVGRTGGFSAELYPRGACPSRELAAEWCCLNDPDATAGRVGMAVHRIVNQLLHNRSQSGR